MKVTGAEFIDWYDNHFPEDFYFESEDAKDTHADDGTWLLDPAATYDTDALGYLEWNLPFDDPRMRHELPQAPSVESLIRKLRKARTHDIVVIEVPKGKLAEVKAATRDLGVKWPK